MEKMQTIQTETHTLVNKGVRLIRHQNIRIRFGIEEIGLVKPENSIEDGLKENLCLDHAQALIFNQRMIPSDWGGKIIIFMASVLEKDNEYFIPAIVSSNGFNDAVALSNRDPDWSIILINPKKIFTKDVYMAVLK